MLYTPFRATPLLTADISELASLTLRSRGETIHVFALNYGVQGASNGTDCEANDT